MRELKIAYGGSRAAKIWSNKLITFDALCERLQHIRPHAGDRRGISPPAPRGARPHQGQGRLCRRLAEKTAGAKPRRSSAAPCSPTTWTSPTPDSSTATACSTAMPPWSTLPTATRRNHPATASSPRFSATSLRKNTSPSPRYLAADYGIDCIDRCSYSAHQLMYWPTTPSNGEYVFERFDGSWLDPDAFLAQHPNWRDVSQLPTSSPRKHAHRPRAQAAERPAGKGRRHRGVQQRALPPAGLPRRASLPTCTSRPPRPTATNTAPPTAWRARSSTTTGTCIPTTPATRPTASCSAPSICCASTGSGIWARRNP